VFVCKKCKKVFSFMSDRDLHQSICKTKYNIEYMKCRYNMDSCINEGTVECEDCVPKYYASTY